MATIYIETATASDLNKNTVSAPANSTKLLTTAPGASSLTITLASSATDVEHWFIAEPADPGSAGGTSPNVGPITVNVTTANMNLNNGTVTCSVHRLNSSGVSQASANLTPPTAIWQSTGVKTCNNILNTAIGTFAATDRLGIRFQISNGAMSVQSVVIEVGLASGNEEVDAPWSAGPATQELAGTSALVTTAAAGLTELLTLGGTSALVTTVSGTLLRIQPVAGTSALVTTATGDLSVSTVVIQELAGTSALTTSASGALTELLGLGAASALTTTATGNLSRLFGLAGTAALTTTAAAGLTELLALAAVSALTTTAAGDVSILGTQELAGTAALTTTAAASLTARLELAAATGLTSSAQGTLAVIRELGGTVQFTTTASGDVIVVAVVPIAVGDAGVSDSYVAVAKIRNTETVSPGIADSSLTLIKIMDRANG